MMDDAALYAEEIKVHLKTYGFPLSKANIGWLNVVAVILAYADVEEKAFHTLWQRALIVLPDKGKLRLNRISRIIVSNAIFNCLPKEKEETA